MSEIQALLVGRRLLVAPLYVDDGLLSQIVMGDKVKQWPAIKAMLRREGMPEPRRAMGSLYYLPAQLRFFDAREGLAPLDYGGFAEEAPASFGP